MSSLSANSGVASSILGTLSSATGLSSGINIQQTVTQLMAINSQPVNNLTATNTTLTSQQTEVTKLSALLLGVQDATQNLGKASVWGSQSATSSNPSALSATVTGSPAAGTYQYTPLQTAQSEQLLSSGFQSAMSSLGGGTFTFRYGNTVNQGVSLANLDGGQGVTPGKIRITDRSGASTVVDLSSAMNIDDVVKAINTSGAVDVTASTSDGHIVLTDNTGASVSDLKVQEVNGGTTAASLGLAGIDLAANSSSNSVSGQNVLTLGTNLSLNALNDGNGIELNTTALGDVSYTLHDGTTGTINLSGQTTLGGVIQAINSKTNGKLQVAIAPDGRSLQITDTTAGANPGGSLSISNATGSTAATGLGLAVGATQAATFQGSRILGGLNTVLLSSLNGGRGTGPLGYMKLTDAAGHSANVNLTSAATLGDVVDAINSQAAGAGAAIKASVNAAGDGIQLTDTSGGTGNLTAANSNSAGDGGSDGLTTATKLGLATASAPGSSSTGTLNSGDLHLETVSQNTLLSSYDGGAGVAQGSFQITDTTGRVSTIQVTSGTQTIGDVVRAINRGTTGVHADINATGDGIVLTDTAHGLGNLSVSDVNSTTASDLGLTATSTTTNGVQSINASTTRTITLKSTDSLTDLQNAINGAGAGLSASIITDSSNKPYRLTLTATQSGRAGNMVVDASQIAGMSIQEMTSGRDAILSLGGGSSSGAAPVLVTSSSNDFTNVLPGATLHVNSPSQQPVSISVSNDGSNIAADLQSLVTNYNNFRSQYTTDTSYNTTTETGSVLSQDPAALQLDQQLGQLLTKQFSTTGSIRTLADVGISVESDGTLSFDQSRFNSAYASDPASVQQLFTASSTGVSAQFNTVITQLAGQGTSLLANRAAALQQEISDNAVTIKRMNQRLTDEQNLLYTQFYNMDLAISKLQSTQKALSSITVLSPNFGSNGSSSSGSSSSSSGG